MTGKQAGIDPDKALSVRRHLLLGCLALAVLAGGFGAWAVTAEISGAIIPSGQAFTPALLV